ncbi:mediator of RNA polymerase II transcription subunit 13 [Ascosphaera aggregata]|nr:mediator of RNA polymerase II transcription subunit 13 [Ascosphaera aggregata]
MRLKGLQRGVFYRNLTDSICKLRNADVLAAPAQDIYAIWAFCHERSFAAMSSFKEKADLEHRAFVIAGRQYIALALGVLDLSELVSKVSTDPSSSLQFQSLHAFDSHDQEGTVDFSAEHITYAAFHEALLSAFRASLLLRLSEGQQYIPLGAQTLFSSIGLEANSLLFDKPLRVNPFLAKLTIDFSSTGKVILACQNAPQPGIEQLQHNESDCLMNVEPDECIWLAPLGIEGKFVGRYKSASLLSNSNEYSEIWKTTVKHWLAKFRLGLDRHEQNFWIEVDVDANDIPFCDATMVAQADQGLLRLLWPAKYSFHRVQHTYHDFSDELEYFTEGAEGPLDFVVRWMSGVSSNDNSVREAENKGAPGKVYMTPIPGHRPPTVNDDGGDFKLPQSLGVPLPYADLFSLAGNVHLTPSDALPIAASGVVVGETTNTVTTVPEAVETTAETNGVYITNGSLPDNESWSLTMLPPALQDADIGPYFSDMVTGEDDPFPTFPAAPFELEGLLNADSLQGDQFLPSDDLFSNIVTDCDFNFDFTTHGAPTFSLASAGLPTLPTTEDFKKSENESVAAMQLVEQAHFDGSADVPPAKYPGLYDEVVDAVTGAMCEASVSCRRSRSSSKSSPPLTPNKIGQLLTQSLSRFDSTRAASGPTVHKAGAETAGRSLLPSDQKYNVDGRFYFDLALLDRIDGADHYSSGVPRLGLSGERLRNAQSIMDLNVSPGEVSGLEQDDSDESTESSEELIGDEGFDQDAKSRKRKWSPSRGSDGEVETEPGLGVPDAYDAQAASIKFNGVIGSLLSSPELESLHGDFTMPRSTVPVLQKPDDQIELAQMIVEVMTQSCFCHVQELYKQLADRRGNGMIASGNFTPLSSDVKSHTLALRELVCLDDLPKPLDKTKSLAASLTQIPQPYVKVRRGGDSVDALASITAFWDTFELEPYYGPKNLQAACIYPVIAADEAQEFIAMISQLYEGQRFGKHETVELVPWTSGTSQATPTYRSAICALFQICTALDGSAAPQRAADNISLQIVPLDFVFDPLSFVVPSRDVLRQLTIEVYTRCQPHPKTDFPKSSPIYLSTRAPTPVAIKLTRQVTSPLINTQSLLHLAYSESFDSRWLTAAWSDHQGRNQAALSFCLRKKEGAVSISLRDIKRRIWMISIDIVQTAHLNSRVIIAKDASYEAEELADWMAIIESFNKQTLKKVDVSFVAVDIYPGLHIKNPSTQKE